MKKKLFLLTLASLLSIPHGFSRVPQPQIEEENVDRQAYPDYVTPQPLSETEREALMNQLFRNRSLRSLTESRPRRVNNIKTKHFPPIFNQDDGSCGSASHIGYMFTHEINSLRDADGKKPENIYPTHFTWLLTYHNSDKTAMAACNGIPNSVVYGGRTYSQLFGRQTHDTNGFGWMQGYDKWYSAMFNRSQSYQDIGNLGDKKSCEWLKHWLWNHCGDNDFHSGGLACVGLASGGNWQRIPEGSYEAGKYYVKHWGRSFDHAMTIVGYDDDIEIDLNGNGTIEEDEKGAWIIANSWGDGWCNNGWIYCPYKNSHSSYNPDNNTYGGPMGFGVYYMRKNYIPKRTIKISMNYSRRNEIEIGAGISQDLTSETPEATTAFHHFRYAGGTTPMLGYWKDGLHEESMEFGYDLTDLSASFDQTKPLKYFFTIQSKNGATGEGFIDSCSIIDYEFDSLGIEIPFKEKNVKILNQGGRTILSVIVPPRPIYPVRNFALTTTSESETLLTWNEPAQSAYTLKGYRLYKNQKVLVELTATDLRYIDQSAQIGDAYQISALYDANTPIAIESTLSPTKVIAGKDNSSNAIRFSLGGFTIPDVFTPKRTNFTIEFWANPSSTRNWNWQIGPGWGTFLFHFNNGGSVSVGYTASEQCRLNEVASIPCNSWTHIAIVSKSNRIYLLLNGKVAASKALEGYNGIENVDKFSIGRDGTYNQQYGLEGEIDEFRIWGKALTEAEVLQKLNSEITSPELESDLLAYYPMDTLPDGRLRDAKGGHHASFLNHSFKFSDNCRKLDGSVPNPEEKIADFELPEAPFYTGKPIEISQVSLKGYSSITWDAPEAGINGLAIKCPTLIYPSAGTYQITMKAGGEGENGQTVTKTIEVQSTPLPKADFEPVYPTVNVGQRISFINHTIGDNCSYEWYFEGGDPERATTANAATSYARFGEYTVKLIARNATGEDVVVKEKVITVNRIAPKADFEASTYEAYVGEPVQLKDLSKNDPTEWLWTVENETIETYTEQNPSITFNKPGVYAVSLKASNVAGENSITKNSFIEIKAGPSGNALNFDGTDDWVEVENLADATPLKAFTIEWWMYAKENVNDTYLLGKAPSSFVVQSSNSGSMKITLENKYILNAASTESKPLIKVGEWIHFAIVFDNSKLTLYKNGGEVTSKKLTGLTESAIWSKGFALGSEIGHTLNGLLDELRIWNVARTQSAIIKDLNAPLANPNDKEGLVLYYNFDQNSGDVQDALEKHTGTRKNFGPDGDAWSKSGAFNVGMDAKKIKIVSDEVNPMKVTVSFENGIGKKRVAFIKKASAASGYPVDETSYNATSNLKEAQSTLPNSGYICVYNGNRNSFTVEGLEELTDYELMIVEYIEEARKPYYLTTSSHATFTTGKDTDKELINSASTHQIYQTEEAICVKLAEDGKQHTVAFYTVDGYLLEKTTGATGEIIISKSTLSTGIYLIEIDGKVSEKISVAQ